MPGIRESRIEVRGYSKDRMMRIETIIMNGNKNAIDDMIQLELQQHLLREYPQENARCEWKEFKNLKNSFRIQKQDSYGTSNKHRRSAEQAEDRVQQD